MTVDDCFYDGNDDKSRLATGGCSGSDGLTLKEYNNSTTCDAAKLSRTI